MNIALIFCSICLITGGLLLVVHVLAGQRASLSVRLARAQGRLSETTAESFAVPEPLRARTERIRAGYEQRLRGAGRSETVGQLMGKKLLLTVAVPLVPLLPYAAAVRHAPSAALVLVLAVCGFFVPDLVLRSEIVRRREEIMLDLPEALSIMALSLRAGQSLRQALELAGRDCDGPLGQEINRALSLARRERGLDAIPFP